MAKEYLTVDGQLILVDGKMVEVPSETEVSDTADEQTELLATTQTLSDGLPDQVVGYVDGSPRGVYDSLSALQTALPNGDLGVYLTTDNGYWYYWNGTAWTYGGVYQATTVQDESISFEKLDRDTQDKLFDNLSNVDESIVHHKPGKNYDMIKHDSSEDDRVIVGNTEEKVVLCGNEERPKYARGLYVSDEKEIAMMDDLREIKLQQADMMEEINGYITALTDETYSELDSAIITDSVEINDNVYNYADGTRAGLVSIEGNTKKASNLLVLNDKEETTTNGITYTIKNGVITLNGTLEISSTYFNFWIPLANVINAGNYYFKNFDYTNYIFNIMGGYNNWSARKNYKGISTNLTLDFNASYLCLQLYNGTVFNDTEIKPMLVVGTTALTTFECGYDGLKSAYTEGISLTNNTETYTINVPKTELCGVGSAKDIIDISKNSKGYYDIDLTKNIGTRDYQSGDESNSEVLTDMTTTYYKLDTPTTTRIASGLTYEQMTAICRIGGTISNLGNDNEAYNVNPDVTIKRVYRLWNKEN